MTGCGTEAMRYENFNCTLEVGNQGIYYSKYILLAATSLAQSTSCIALLPQTIYCTRIVTI